MTELMQAHHQWATRPADECYTSIPAMLDYKLQLRANSRAKVIPSKVLSVQPTDETGNAGLVVSGANGTSYAPTNWAFGQLAQLAGAPAGYLRTLPAAIASDAINFGLQFNRQAEEVGVLLQRPATIDGTVMIDGNTPAAPQLVAATGPKYGRIWDADVLKATYDRFGDGVTGRFRVPSERGREGAPITKANTTLYAGDRDMFLFLADEHNKVEVPNRRNGESGFLSRGFFMWNSEVGSTSFGVATFLYDDMCCNHIVWGAAEYREVRIRHSSLAPERFLSEIAPALKTYSNSDTTAITSAVEAARAAKITGADKDTVTEFLAKRFGKGRAQAIQTAHMLEEQRPIETLWDAVVGATAVARSIAWQGDRVALERQAGELLDLAS